VKLTALKSRIIALGLLALAIVCVGLVTLGPVLVLHGTQADRIEARAHELMTYQRLAAGQAKFEQQLSALNQRSVATDYQVQGDTPALASANMQKHLKNIVTRNRAEVISTQIVTPDDGEVGNRVSLKVHLRADIKAAMAILHALESGRPMLFVDDLAISARPVRGRTADDPPTIQLDLQFEIDGYTASQSS
jgi:general secretion pathway protein M